MTAPAQDKLFHVKHKFAIRRNNFQAGRNNFKGERNKIKDGRNKIKIGRNKNQTPVFFPQSWGFKDLRPIVTSSPPLVALSGPSHARHAQSLARGACARNFRANTNRIAHNSGKRKQKFAASHHRIGAKPLMRKMNLLP